MRRLELPGTRVRLVLPCPSEADAPLSYFTINKNHLESTNPVFPDGFYTRDFWEKRLEGSIGEYERDESVRLFIELLGAPGEFIGAINFTQIMRGPFQACYLGYSIGARHEGMGFMREALEIAIRFVFEERHIHRIMANHLLENSKSADLLKRLGFRVDGFSPEYLFIRGSWCSHVLNSLTNPKWTPRNEDRSSFTAPLVS